MPHEAGELLGGRYRLDDRIASGGMGDVWRATDTVLGRQVAVKTLRADRAVDPQFQTRFAHEARTMAALHHPGIADVYDFGQQPGNEAYLVMAHVNGQPLDRRIAAHGRLSPAETMSVVAQTGRALQAAHEAGIVHRDVKPANLIVQPDGTVVLVDFGIARSTRSAALTGTQEVLGTASYIAPEQVSKGAVGPAADVYALGAVAYHCLSGHPPFLGDNAVAVAMRHLADEPPPLPEDVPPPVRGLVTTALAKDPAARFPSAAAMAAAADSAAGGAPAGGEAVTVPLTPVRPGYAPPPPDGSAGRTRRRVVLAAGTALLILLGVAAALALTALVDGLPGAPGPASSAPATPPTAATRTRPAPPADGDDGTGGTTRTPTPSPRPSGGSAGPGPSSQPVTTTPTSTPPTTTPTTRPETGGPQSSARGVE